MTNKYVDRKQAGMILAQDLPSFVFKEEVLVLALPRGGVPVAFEIAKAFGLALDVFVVRKLGVPGHQELAMGAIAPGNVVILNEKIIQELGVTPEEIARVREREQEELKRREIAYRGNHVFPPLTNKTIILVDDGMATGATMRVAIKALKQLGVENLMVAVPVADNQVCEAIQPLVTALVCPLRPLHFQAVGAWYEDFSQTEDEEVRTLLQAAKQWSHPHA